jgi:hypothetical protein
MKLCKGWVMSAGLLLAARSANAQTVVTAGGHGPRYSAVSDLDGPYAAMPPGAPGYGPRLLPAPEVYTVLRDNGFSPLGAPHQRGFFYSIAVLDRDGGEGRLVIDARDGRIVRYMRGYADESAAYGPPGEPPPVIRAVRGPPRPPAPVPHVASRTSGVPLPKAMPQRLDAPQTVGKAVEPAKESVKEAVRETAKETAKVPESANTPESAKAAEPAPQSVAQVKPAAVPAAPPAVIEAKPEVKPSPQIQPTKEMPRVQDLE